MTTRFYRRSFFLVLLTGFGLCLAITRGEDADSEKRWDAPATEAKKKNPITSNASSVDAGEKIYLKRCVSCHGKTGNGDGPNAIDLGLHPTKFSDPKVHQESDGALYWKISVGRKPMPRYDARLSPNDRWNVINYLRTLASGGTKS